MRAEPNHLRRVLTIWIVLSILGVLAVVFLMPLLMPEAASDVAGFSRLTVIVFTAAAMPVALFVWVFLGYSVAVFRSSQRPDSYAPRILATPRMQAGWLAVTGALTAFLLIWGFIGLAQQATAAPSSTLIVDVTGQQWAWSFSYPQYHVRSAQLNLAVNRPVQFRVASRDVLHGFSVLELGVRVDANPGEVVTSPVITPSRTGTFEVRCIELCGLNHSLMATQVRVLSPGAFSSWVVEQGGHP
jgi:cytochrome c oxidase subunit II